MILTTIPAPKHARTAHEATITALRVNPTGWRHTAEITGLLAIATLVWAVLT